jgi:hypothetical protein
MVKLRVLQAVTRFEYHKRIRCEEIVVAKALQVDRTRVSWSYFRKQDY